MKELEFFDAALNDQLGEAAVAARYLGDWLLLRVGEGAFALPAADREEGEHIYAVAQRIMGEQVGAAEYQLEPVNAYRVTEPGEAPRFGGLFFAEVEELGRSPAANKAARIGEQAAQGALEGVQADLLKRVQEWLAAGNFRAEWENLFEYMM